MTTTNFFGLAMIVAILVLPTAFWGDAAIRKDSDNDAPGVMSGTDRTANSAAKLLLASQGECSRRLGPYATQETAWQRWRQAQRDGYGVSRSVFPCYAPEGGGGYCFTVFYRC